jgi:hypothetical protein
MVIHSGGSFYIGKRDLILGGIVVLCDEKK